MSKRPAQTHLFRILTLSLAVTLIGGGIAFLYQWHQGATSSLASSDSVVGQPSLPASYVDAIFRRLGSPMVGTGQAVEAASRAQNIDDAFALAVWWTETNDGAAGVGLADRNPGSVRGSVGYPSAYDGYTIYPSYSAAVTYWFSMLKKVYINRGLTTVYAISHPYVGTSTSNLWAGKVVALMQTYRAEAPAKPTPTPTPSIPSDLARQTKALAGEDQQQAQGVVPPTVVPGTYQPQNPQPASQTRTVAAPTSTGLLSGNSRTILVLFDLLLALVLAAWAWGTIKRYSRRVQPAPAVQQATSDPWIQVRAKQSQSAAFFDSFSGLARTTEDLAAREFDPAILLATTEILPAYTTPEPAFAQSGPATGQMSFADEQTPQLSFTEQLPSFFNTPATGYPPLSRLPGLLDRTGSLAQNSWHQAESRSLFGGQFSIPRPGETADQSPQPVGAGAGTGRSNGLLSRYREMQAQGTGRE